LLRRAIALFVKAPVEAAVKTRLVPPLSYAQAADLASAFLRDSSDAIARIAVSLGAAPCLFFDPPSARQSIRCAVPAAFELYPQCDGDLALRLASAYESLAARGMTDVCFVGADSPTLPLAYVRAAFAALDAGRDVAIGPASDGGYYLIGLRGAHPGIFERIEWSTSRVFAQTCERAAELGLSLEPLAEWYDIDDASGLDRLRAELLDPQTGVAIGETAPRTKSVLVSFEASDRMP
jgi:rSAM/selenodomain-associated transferase 1